MKSFFTYAHMLVAIQFSLIGAMLFFSHGLLGSAAGLAIFALGAAIGFYALAHNKSGNFNIRPVLREGCTLITTGPYRYIRHPMYTSVITMMLGVLISTPNLYQALMFAALTATLYLKARREESLWCGHDENYLHYKRDTKLFIPFIL